MSPGVRIHSCERYIAVGVDGMAHSPENWGVSLGTLYEELLMADPSRMEGRPGSADAV
jgi:hypothetical protein